MHFLWIFDFDWMKLVPRIFCLGVRIWVTYFRLHTNLTSHKSQPANFVLKAQCTTPRSLNICETKTAGHVVVVYQNTATEEFLFQTSFFCWVCVKAHEWYTSTVEQQNWVTRKSWWSACCVSILEWIQHKSHALYVSHELKEKKRNVCCVPENSHLCCSLRAPR